MKEKAGVAGVAFESEAEEEEAEVEDDEAATPVKGGKLNVRDAFESLEEDEAPVNGGKVNVGRAEEDEDAVDADVERDVPKVKAGRAGAAVSSSFFLFVSLS